LFPESLCDSNCESDALVNANPIKSVLSAWLRRRPETGGARVSDDAVAKMVAALEAAGVEFTNGSEPGVKLKAKAR
jgi:hypothetical protein